MKITLLVIFTLAGHIALAQQKVYPLHVGNHWDYFPHSYGLTSINIKRDTLMPNGKRYSVLQHEPGAWTSYERQDSHRVYRYFTGMNSEVLWYDFTISPGDTVNSFARDSDTTDIILSDYRVDSIFGRLRETWTFSIDWDRRYIDDEYTDEITDSLGLTAYTSAFEYSTLRSAVIDGVEYGVSTDLREPSSLSADTFQLLSNYPNPFNSQSIITFNLLSPSKVRLEIYDMLGREVATPFDGSLNPGIHDIPFNATGLNSGIYLIRLLLSREIRIGKMVYTK